MDRSPHRGNILMVNRMNLVTTQTQSSVVKVAALVVIIAGMKAANSLIVPFLLAIFLAIICAPLLFWLKRKNVPEMLGIIMILAIVVGVWLALAMLVSTALNEFSRNIPYYQDRLDLILKSLLNWLAGMGVIIDSSFAMEIVNPGKVMRLIGGTLNGLGGMLTNAFLILLTFVFLMLEAAGIPEKIRAMRGNSENSLDEYVLITSGVNRYLGIKTLTSLATATAVYGLLSLQKIDFVILWAVFAFLLNFVPNIGSIIAAIPAVLLALIQLGPANAAITVTGYLVINIIIGSILEPRIMGRSVGLSTLVVFLSLTFWGWVLGPVGMLLSVPLTMTIKIALSGNESTRWIGLLLGSNKDVSAYLKQHRLSVSDLPDEATGTSSRS